MNKNGLTSDSSRADRRRDTDFGARPEFPTEPDPLWRARLRRRSGRSGVTVASWATLLLIAACGGQTELEPEIVTLSGHLVWGHEVRSFVACGASEEMWVVDGTGREVRRVYEARASIPYQKIFVEVRGVAGPAPESGFGAEYDGALRVAEVRRAEAEGHGCGEDPAGLDFRASGVEPFWSLIIGRSGLRLTRLDSAGTAEWPYTAAMRDGPVTRYHSVGEGEDSIEVVISETRCIDAMSGSLFAFSVEVRLPGEALRGCGMAGSGWETEPPR